MTPEAITALFTRDGQFRCARWGRPVAPVIFGLADETLDIFRSVLRAGFAHARHPMTDTDPEMGANLFLFFCRDWSELDPVPDLDRLTGQPDLAARLRAENAGQFRMFRFDPDGGIRACLYFLRIPDNTDLHPAALAEVIFTRAALSFAQDQAVTPELAALIRAAYDPALPVCATDASHALRLAARMA
ncbi:MAG: hypothetical protein Q4G24_12340 [Paracoccus sp. (in: a-proteobacteria)]|uniref:hypothetical protein n=1 Tax=Paracoccus sp. TaxID=267 RepID=UPI0026DF315F|nr:hypothetical protein [Paracoccus sp. (in: a-proteobacteria)]MDO5622248.1 hypothetical protein [Paracoccus sp. (in: a-proteobacteria)]